MTTHFTEPTEDARLNAYQLGIFVLCGICLVIDGFDVQAMGYVAPAIIQDWQLAKELMAPVFRSRISLANVGALP